jgi:glycosyltransferase involved in cell wall biosynthesis
MKIVYFIDHLRPDGTQRVLQQLVEGLTARGHSQTVICLNDSWDSAVIARLRASDAEVFTLGKRSILGGYGLLALWVFLRRRRYDTAVTLLFYSDVVGRLLARLAGIPHIVSSIRARNTNYAAWQRCLVRSTMRWADTIILNSAGVRDFAITVEGTSPERIIVIPNGVCIGDYQVSISREALCAEFGLVPGRFVVGSVGRLTYQKGFDLLIAAMARLRACDVDLLLIGAGEEESNLRAQADALGLGEHVHFVGYRRDVPYLLGALDLYVHPARFEGMPNALLEAMAAGCPIVASNVDGNRELISNEQYGWLVPPADPHVLSETIENMLTDRDEALRRGQAAQWRVEELFSTTMMIDAWEAALLQRHSL